MEKSGIQERIAELSVILSSLSEEQILQYLNRYYAPKAVFTSSLGKEDQLLTYLIAKNQMNIRVATLDTGRLFPESYTLLATTRKELGIDIEVFYPDQNQLEPYVNKNGIDAFYDSVDLRKQCCFIRKVAPLKRALKGAEIWVTGIRGEHNELRGTMPMVEWDEGNQLIKIHPLLNMTSAKLDEIIIQHNIPVNPRHDQGFVSIGCAPCTKAIGPTQHPRAGRWWWENETKECGLHYSS